MTLLFDRICTSSLLRSSIVSPFRLCTSLPWREISISSGTLVYLNVAGALLTLEESNGAFCRACAVFAPDNV